MLSYFQTALPPVYRIVVIKLTDEDLTKLQTEGVIQEENSGVDGCRVSIVMDNTQQED